MKKNDGDEIAYPSTPDRLIGSENDGNSDSIKFSLLQKNRNSNSEMPSINNAYNPRYKEYR
jgi:hypothetical protein